LSNTPVLTNILLTNIVVLVIFLIVVRTLKQEIKQNKPFAGIEHAVFLGLQRTADILMTNVVCVLKQENLTFPQYNILRILRGAGTEGLPVGEIGERMVTREPDVTRLLDRLENRNFVVRSRETKDRRVVTARITNEGLELLCNLDAKVETMEKSLLEHLDEEKLRQLAQLLDEVRNVNE